MDTNMIYLFYTLVLALLAVLIWFFIRQGSHGNDQHNGGGHRGLDEFNHLPVEENGDE